MTARKVAIAVLAIALIAVLTYLRDPAWLAGIESGFGPWTAEADGTRFRWASTHASFFVPSDRREMTLAVRAPIEGTNSWRPIVSVTVDDQLRARVELADGNWKDLTVDLRHETSRRVRRIDVRVEPARDGARAIQAGVPQTK